MEAWTKYLYAAAYKYFFERKNNNPIPSSIWLSLSYRGRKAPGVRFPATLSCRAAAVVWRLALLCQYVSDGAFRPPWRRQDSVQEI